MGPKLVNMKLSKAEADAKMGGPSTLATDEPLYPWGLYLNLDNGTLDKLSLDFADLKVGASMTLIAKVEVTSISSNESQGQDANQSAGLQITDLCLEDGAGKATAAAATLYK